jgi:hypothetical protein
MHRGTGFNANRLEGVLKNRTMRFPMTPFTADDGGVKTLAQAKAFQNGVQGRVPIADDRESDVMLFENLNDFDGSRRDIPSLSGIKVFDQLLMPSSMTCGEFRERFRQR